MLPLCDHQLSHQRCKVEPCTISTVRHLVRLDDDSGGAAAEDPLSAFLFGIVEALSGDMCGHQVTTWENGGKNQTSFEIIIFTETPACLEVTLNKMQRKLSNNKLQEPKRKD